MKINKKALRLVEIGLKPDTVARMSDSQISVLHNKLIGEQTNRGSINVKSTLPNAVDTAKKLAAQGISVNMTEKEMTEQPDTEVSSMDKTAGGTTQDPHQVPAPDGMGDLGDKLIDKETEVTEEKGSKSNPWAICTAQMGKDFGTSERSEWSKTQMKKYERCVKDVKKSLKEGKNPLSLFIENKLMELVAKHIPPMMTKRELIKHLSENSPGVAPSKPKTSPDTKPGKPKERPQKPKNPLWNPNPGEKPAPKAKREEAKKKMIDVIGDILKK